ncbi:MAG: hypothetical protein R2882_15165 [Gemmatimonadales bacterium]
MTALLGRTGIDLSGALGDQLSVSGAIVSRSCIPPSGCLGPGRGWPSCSSLGIAASLYPM